MKTHLLKYIAIFLIFIGLNANAQTRYIDNMKDRIINSIEVLKEDKK